MDHSQASSLFDAYFSNLLDRAQVREFHAHINDCEDCKVRLRTMRAGAEMGRRWSRTGAGRFGNDDDKLRMIIFKNRVITYAAVAVLVGFFIVLRLLVFKN